MKYTIIVRPEAEIELQEAFSWYETQSKGLGLEFVRSIDASLSSIIRSPIMYAVIYRNIHRTLIRKFPFEIFYLIEQNKIIVIAFFHAKRNPKFWQKRK